MADLMDVGGDGGLPEGEATGDAPGRAPEPFLL